MAKLVLAFLLEPYAVQGRRYAHIVGWSDPLSPMGQRIDNAGKPRVPMPKEDDKTIDGWFREHRRVFSESLRDSRNFAEVREHSPKSSESLREVPYEGGAYAHARALDQEYGIGDLPPNPHEDVGAGGCETLTDAFAAGVREVTGSAFVVTHQRDGRLRKLVESFGPNGTSSAGEQAAWLRRRAAEFARSVDPRFGGFTVARLAKWLNSGAPTGPSAPASDPAPPSPEARKAARREAKRVEAAIATKAAADGVVLAEALGAFPDPPDDSNVRRVRALDDAEGLAQEEERRR